MITPEAIQAHNRLCESFKANIERGPWSNEPNRFEWKHLGFNCLMVRVPWSLHWCGYVGVPPAHPLHGKGYDDIDVSIHGGLTFAEACDGQVCHVPEAGEPEDLWWFGFDCAHAGDLRPTELLLRKACPELTEFTGRWKHLLPEEDTYKDFSYAKRETEKLAQQLSKGGHA